jgi:uncharacterized protein with HEPN domain
MPPEDRNWRFRVEDILGAIEAIQSYTEGVDFDKFVRDRRTVDAVVRNFIIIGEATAHIPAEVRTGNPKLPWDEMRAMRNIVVHEYFGVTDRILLDVYWKVQRTNEAPGDRT